MSVNKVCNIVNFAINDEPEGIFSIVFGHLGASECLVGHDLKFCEALLRAERIGQSEQEKRALQIGKKIEESKTKIKTEEKV